jgi:hypothetical protein
MLFIELIVIRHISGVLKRLLHSDTVFFSRQNFAIQCLKKIRRLPRVKHLHKVAPGLLWNLLEKYLQINPSVSHRGGSGSIPRQSIRDLWSVKCHWFFFFFDWVRLFSSFSIIPANIHRIHTAEHSRYKTLPIDSIAHTHTLSNFTKIKSMSLSKHLQKLANVFCRCGGVFWETLDCFVLV